MAKPTNDTQAPPLLPSGSGGAFDSRRELGIGFGDMLGDFLASLLDLGYCRLLLNNSCFKILE
jgi:hypothetical protein